MVASALVFGVLALALVALGIRGRRTDRAALCRGCRYELAPDVDGLSLDRCPECGRPAGRVRVGHRRLNKRALAGGLGVGVIALAFTGLAYVQRHGVPNNLKPAWVLRNELSSPDNRVSAKAADELAARIADGRVGQTGAARIASVLVGVQGRPGSTWDYSFAKLLSGVDTAYGLTDEHVESLAGNVFSATLEASPYYGENGLVPVRFVEKIRSYQTCPYNYLAVVHLPREEWWPQAGFYGEVPGPPVMGLFGSLNPGGPLRLPERLVNERSGIIEYDLTVYRMPRSVTWPQAYKLVLDDRRDELRRLAVKTEVVQQRTRPVRRLPLESFTLVRNASYDAAYTERLLREKPELKELRFKVSRLGESGIPHLYFGASRITFDKGLAFGAQARLEDGTCLDLGYFVFPPTEPGQCPQFATAGLVLPIPPDASSIPGLQIEIELFPAFEGGDAQGWDGFETIGPAVLDPIMPPDELSAILENSGC